MSQDTIADALNNIMNAKRAGKDCVVVTRFSKVLVGVLEIAKKKGYIESYKTDKTKFEIKFSEELNQCGVIKPRHNVAKKGIQIRDL